MSYTLAATRLNKAMVLRAIRSGKIPGRADASGTRRVEPAEPYLVYRAFAGIDAASRYAASDPAAFAAQLAGLKQVAELLRGELEDMRRDRDAWRDEAQRLALAE
jgi:hypothetical protein